MLAFAQGLHPLTMAPETFYRGPPSRRHQTSFSGGAGSSPDPREPWSRSVHRKSV